MSVTRIATYAVAILTLGASHHAFAQNYEYTISDQRVDREAIELANPSYPRSGIRAGQEGWVRVNFVITPDGRAIDPIIVDSVGGSVFEQSVRKAMADWRFQSADLQDSNNVYDIRFEIKRGRDLATSNFMRRYRRIVSLLHNENNEDARIEVDRAADLGGWNLYESTMLWLMLGRVEGAEGNDAGKLESYRRALGVSNRNSLENDDRRELLRKIFELEMAASQYTSASKTLAVLRKVVGSAPEIAALGDLIADLDKNLQNPEPMSATATIYNPADSDDSVPLWAYQPVRPSFSFAALNGNVERFEVRCEHDRMQGLVEANKTWSLPKSAGACQVFVFGEDGASFQFVEHASADDSDATEPATVAGSNVLD